jgi:hypothetical protein
MSVGAHAAGEACENQTSVERNLVRTHRKSKRILEAGDSDDLAR